MAAKNASTQTLAKPVPTPEPFVPVQTLLPLPPYVIEPEAWAKEASARASEYAGMPESALFLMQARRFLALANELKTLKTEIQTLKASNVERR